MTEKEHQEVLAEFNAMISQAWGETEGYSVSHDPALARNLEWLRDSYLELYNKLKNN